MDRRATLSTFFGLRAESESQSYAQAPRPINAGLEPFTGTWTKEHAAHLLRRTMYGPTFAQINLSANAGLQATLDQLLTDPGNPAAPLNLINEEDPNVPIGQTWVDAPYVWNVDVLDYRNRSLRAWFMDNTLTQEGSIFQKMVLFWHNHFVVSDVDDPKYAYQYLTVIGNNALGNFKQFVKDITINPAMLRYLNGNQNRNLAPNENYARELLELFTIGKGPLIGPGDYTNYTEEDISEIAKVLTGWVDRGFFTQDANQAVESDFLSFWHDTSTKTLTSKFNNAVITNNGEQEYADLIDIIFEQDEVSRFICRKLYRYFVYYLIDDTVEQNVIEPMAQIMRDNDYDIVPALRALLESEHFFDELNRGVMIKNPIDFINGAMKSLEMDIATDPVQRYSFMLQYSWMLGPLQMTPFFMPSVAGWPAYYQEPAYYRIWINSVTLPYRQNITDAIAWAGFDVAGHFNAINPLELIATLSDPYDPNTLIEDLALVLFPNGVTPAQVDFLKTALIFGLPDFEWTTEYANYIANPDDTNLENSVTVKVRNLIRTMLYLSEFYLS